MLFLAVERGIEVLPLYRCIFSALRAETMNSARLFGVAPGKIEIPAAHQPEELVHLMRCDTYISRYPADCLEHLNIVSRLAQPQLREYLLDVHIGLAEIGKAYLFEEVTCQCEPYAVYLAGDPSCYLYAALLI